MFYNHYQFGPHRRICNIIRVPASALPETTSENGTNDDDTATASPTSCRDLAQRAPVSTNLGHKTEICV